MSKQALQKREEQTPATQPVNQYTFTPKVDIWENDNGYFLEVEMPGVDQNGVDLKVEDGVLSILGRVRPDSFDQYERTWTEYETGNYERQFQISDEIDEEKIQAAIKLGVLSITLPKREAVKPKRISVKAG